MYCDEIVSVCLSVCLSAIISSELHVRSSPTNFFVRVTYGRGSVLLWQRSDTLCTSGCMDDVICAHKSFDRRRRPGEAQSTRSLGLGYKLCAVIPAAGQRTHGTTFRTLKVTFQVATTRAASASMTALLDLLKLR